MNFGFGAMKQQNEGFMSFEAAMKYFKDNNFSKLEDKLSGTLKTDTSGLK